MYFSPSRIYSRGYRATQTFEQLHLPPCVFTGEIEMPSSAILDVAIGIAFVYLFLSLICSVVNEGIAAVFRCAPRTWWPASTACSPAARLPDGRPVVELLYSHGLIRGLYKDPPADVIAKARAANPIGKLQDQAEALAEGRGAREPASHSGAGHGSPMVLRQSSCLHSFAGIRHRAHRHPVASRSITGARPERRARGHRQAAARPSHGRP